MAGKLRAIARVPSLLPVSSWLCSAQPLFLRYSWSLYFCGKKMKELFTRPYMGFPTLNIKHARSQFLSSACCCAKGAKTGPMAKGRLSSPEARRSGGLWLQSLELPAEVCFRLLPFLQTLQCLNHDTISVHWSRAFQPLCHNIVKAEPSAGAASLPQL